MLRQLMTGAGMSVTVLQTDELQRTEALLDTVCSRDSDSFHLFVNAEIGNLPLRLGSML
jgi:hypothetical protein